jgi:hypothetical protein
VAVSGPAARNVATSSFYLDGRLLKRDRRAPFTAVVPRRLARPGGSLLEVLVTLRDSRRQTLTRAIAGCG